jgi:hypothetical protein
MVFDLPKVGFQLTDPAKLRDRSLRFLLFQNPNGSRSFTSAFIRAISGQTRIELAFLRPKNSPMELLIEGEQIEHADVNPDDDQDDVRDEFLPRSVGRRSHFAGSPDCHGGGQVLGGRLRK